MRTTSVFFVALLAIPIVQLVFDPRLARPGAPVIDRSSKVMIAVGKHFWTRDVELPSAPKPERRPRVS
jgi:hypothetical protein